MESDSVILFIVLGVLIILSALFSSAETAYISVNRVKIQSLVEDGNKSAKRVLSILDNQSKFLSAILIGNNIVNLSASSIATTLGVRLLGSYGAGVATGILTFVVLIIGEVAPKTIATIYSTNLTIAYSVPVAFLMWILTPFIFIVNKITGAFLWIFGIRNEGPDDTLTEEELRILVDQGHEKGVIEGDEREYIHNVFDFSDSTAKEIMIPRIDVTFIDVNCTYEELIEKFKENMFTRFPVYENDPDNIIGFINMKDLIIAPRDESFHVRDYLREVYFTYDQKNTSDLFDEMRKDRLSFAIVMDEYGAVDGLVTLEDLIEELVGDIKDEFDDNEEDEIIQLSENEYEVSGSMNLEDFCEEVGIDLISEDYDTIGGYITGMLEHFPEEKEELVNDLLEIRVDEVEGKRITKARVKVIQTEDSEDE